MADSRPHPTFSLWQESKSVSPTFQTSPLLAMYHHPLSEVVFTRLDDWSHPIFSPWRQVNWQCKTLAKHGSVPRSKSQVLSTINEQVIP